MPYIRKMQLIDSIARIPLRFCLVATVFLQENILNQKAALLVHVL